LTLVIYKSTVVFVTVPPLVHMLVCHLAKDLNNQLYSFF